MSHKSRVMNNSVTKKLYELSITRM